MVVGARTPSSGLLLIVAGFGVDAGQGCVDRSLAILNLLRRVPLGWSLCKAAAVLLAVGVVVGEVGEVGGVGGVGGVGPEGGGPAVLLRGNSTLFSD